MGAELLELRAHFGVSATEALQGMPAWEYDLLVGAIRAGALDENAQEPNDEPSDIDLDAEPTGPPLPAGLEGLL